MSLQVDLLTERMKLRSDLKTWKSVAIAFVVLTFIILLGKNFDLFADKKPNSYVARIHINGMIVEDMEILKNIRKLKDNNSVKAIIMHVNSPGGTIVGGESLYKALLDTAQTKPVVAVFGSLATSGAYMIASAADHIVSHEGTITGSIGVIMESFKIDGLANKVGVDFKTYRSVPLKGEPLPFGETSQKAQNVLNDMLDDAHNLFVDIVDAGRPEMERDEIVPLADGRVYTGRQALDVGLVDTLGSEKEAMDWLKSEKGIPDIEITDFNLKNKKSPFEQLFEAAVDQEIFASAKQLFMPPTAIMAIWSPRHM